MHPLVLAVLALPLAGMLVHLAITSSVARAFARIMARGNARFAALRSSEEWRRAQQVRHGLHGGVHRARVLAHATLGEHALPWA